MPKWYRLNRDPNVLEDLCREVTIVWSRHLDFSKAPPSAFAKNVWGEGWLIPEEFGSFSLLGEIWSMGRPAMSARIWQILYLEKFEGRLISALSIAQRGVLLC